MIISYLSAADGADADDAVAATFSPFDRIVWATKSIG